VTPTELVIDVLGVAIPQGSKNARVAHGKAIMYEANKRLAPWRADIIRAAEARARLCDWIMLNGPVEVRIDFYLPRPKSVPEAARRWPCVKPDADKLTRAVFDSLTIARIIADDARIVHHDVWKHYARATAGARIRVAAMSDQLAVL
jgi:crossover junction endodeoxyribonuclease RusA